MTSVEKIANARKRIDELERLIQCWNKSEEESSGKLNSPFKIDNKAA
tara:strand:- start:114 stop:254 length:141 start_codon:yes stop_codon:yes gene_type:complete